MSLVRNTSSRDLDVAGRVFPAGAAVEVSDVEAGWLDSNPNFQLVTDPPSGPDDGAPATSSRKANNRPRAGKAE